MSESNSVNISADSLPELLKDDTKVKIAGVDLDGILRGKLMSKKKFLSIASDGFGFCSLVFGWDMHDQTYFKELKVSNKENGYRDLIAVPDLSSFRRIPWENDVPFFLVTFFDPSTRKPISVCPRGLLRTAADRLTKNGLTALAGGEHFLGRCFRTCRRMCDLAFFRLTGVNASRVRVLPISSACQL